VNHEQNHVSNTGAITSTTTATSTEDQDNKAVDLKGNNAFWT